MNITTGATLTGGSSVTLTPAGIQPGRSVFVGPDHTRLTPRTVEFTTSQTPPSTKNKVPGVGRTGLKIRFAGHTATEGCCDAQMDEAVVDLGVRVGLTPNSDTLADAIIDYLKGVVYTAAFEDAVRKSILPQS